MDTLPLDVVRKIIDHLGYKDKVRFCIVTKESYTKSTGEGYRLRKISKEARQPGVTVVV